MHARQQSSTSSWDTHLVRLSEYPALMVGFIQSPRTRRHRQLVRLLHPPYRGRPSSAILGGSTCHHVYVHPSDQSVVLHHCIHPHDGGSALIAYIHLEDKWFHNHYVIPLASCPFWTLCTSVSCPFWTLHYNTHENITFLVAVPGRPLVSSSGKLLSPSSLAIHTNQITGHCALHIRRWNMSLHSVIYFTKLQPLQP
jgi:hypothetical protein